MLQFIDELISQVFRVKTLGQLGSGFPHDEGNIVVIRRCLVCVAGRYSCHIENPLYPKSCVNVATSTKALLTPSARPLKILWAASVFKTINLPVG